jgi:hypothetical protein
MNNEQRIMEPAGALHATLLQTHPALTGFGTLLGVLSICRTLKRIQNTLLAIAKSVKIIENMFLKILEA